MRAPPMMHTSAKVSDKRHTNRHTHTYHITRQRQQRRSRRAREKSWHCAYGRSVEHAFLFSQQRIYFVVMVVLLCSSHACTPGKRKRSCDAFISCLLFNSSSRYTYGANRLYCGEWNELHLRQSHCIGYVGAAMENNARKIMPVDFQREKKMDAQNTRAQITIKWWSSMASDSNMIFSYHFGCVP